MTDKRQKATKVKYKCESLQVQSSQYLWNTVFSKRSIWVLLEFVGRWTQYVTKIDQKARKIGQIYILEPHDYQMYYVKTDMCNQYGISASESQKSLCAKRPQRRRRRRNRCFRSLIQSLWISLPQLESCESQLCF